MGTSLKLDKYNIPVGETSESIVQGSEEASSSKIKQYEITESREGLEQKYTAGVDASDNDNEITESRKGFEQKNTAGVDAPDNDNGYLKMNVTGCIRESTKKAGFGGVFKDATGAWILGFYGKLQPCTGLDAEIWSIYRGITIAFSRNWTNVEIASDCATAVSIFQGSLNGPGSMLSKIREGIHLMQRVNGRIKHVAREANEVAEVMANLGVEQDEDLHWMTNPPEDVKGLINDLTGIEPASQGNDLNLGSFNSHSDMATPGDPASQGNGDPIRKLYVAGCSKKNTEKAGFGGEVIDARSVLRFYGKLDPCTSLEANIWSIYWGISIAHHNNWINVDIRSDSPTAVGIFNRRLDGPSSMRTKVQHGLHLMQTCHGTITEGIPGYSHAEVMADLGVEQDEYLKVMTDPPEVVTGYGYDPATLANSLNNRILGLRPETQPSYYKIFRIPEKLRQLNDKVHTPHLVSIGPLHHGEPELMGMEDYKLRCLQAYLKRTLLSLESCFALMEEFVQEARNCYIETLAVNSDEFFTMVLVDSCFVIESMMRYWRDPAEEGNFHFVRSDMILVGNQLPFFVLDKIYDFAVNFNRNGSDIRAPTTFVELSVRYFKTILLINDPPDTSGLSKDGIKHLLDLVRLLHLPSKKSRSKEHSGQPYARIPTASVLQEAGLKFECGTSKPYLDLTYNSKGVLEIPQLLLDNRADLLLINMIALEVNSYLDESYILDFVVFMDDLISTGKDVDILVESGIIRNYIGESQAIADKFNRLTSHSVLGNYYFGNIASGVNSYYKDRHNQWRATLKRDYCGSPFKVASVIAATILLILTFMQTLGTIFGLPKKFAFILLWVTGGSVLSILGAVVVMSYCSVLLRRMRLRRRRRSLLWQQLGLYTDWLGQV